jgi:DNA-binding winged helix-turn-helix (wHTH) protein
MRVRLGTSVLDTDLRQLTREGTVTPLSPKAFRSLEVLAEHQPRPVSHADLRARVWPDLRAGGTTLARLVNEIRVALGDEAGSARLIRTVPRFGYALDGCVVEPPAPEGAAIVFFLEWDKRLIPLPPGEHVIGRAADALVSVASDRVSRRHALIVVTGDTAAIQDLDSKNGTYIGATRIDRTVDLKNGDRILVGPAMLIFRTRPDDDSTASATRV